MKNSRVKMREDIRKNREAARALREILDQYKGEMIVKMALQVIETNIVGLEEIEKNDQLTGDP